jgi:hypothetical protein
MIPTLTRVEWLVRIDAALESMRARGHDQTEHYTNLLRKREAYARGEGEVVDVAEQVIADVGRCIGRLARERFTFAARLHGCDFSTGPKRGRYAA